MYHTETKQIIVSLFHNPSNTIVHCNSQSGRSPSHGASRPNHPREAQVPACIAPAEKHAGSRRHRGPFHWQYSSSPRPIGHFSCSRRLGEKQSYRGRSLKLHKHGGPLGRGRTRSRVVGWSSAGRDWWACNLSPGVSWGSAWAADGKASVLWLSSVILKLKHAVCF